MSDFEERLRVLLNEQVDARVGPHRPVPEFTIVPASRTRGRRPRPAWMLPLLAAACVLAVGGGAIGATRMLATPERHTVASKPTASDAPTTAAATTPVTPSAPASRSVKTRTTSAPRTSAHHARSSTRLAANPAPRPAARSTPPSSPAASDSSSAPPPAPCDGANLAVTDPHAITTPTDGQAYVIFRNTAAVACTLQGTPTVVLVDGAGADGGTATPTGNVTDRSGTGPAPLVTLEPDGYAAAAIHWQSPDYSAPAGTCPDFAQLRVTAPDTTTAGTATASEVMHVCPTDGGATSLTVDALVAGYPW